MTAVSSGTLKDIIIRAGARGSSDAIASGVHVHWCPDSH